jgi:hypothetical protein
MIQWHTNVDHLSFLAENLTISTPLSLASAARAELEAAQQQAEALEHQLAAQRDAARDAGAAAEAASAEAGQLRQDLALATQVGTPVHSDRSTFGGGSRLQWLGGVPKQCGHGCLATRLRWFGTSDSRSPAS